MTTPTVTELTLRREPTISGSFLDSALDRAAVAPVVRELDRRHSDGIDVRLLWNQTADQVVVAVFDAKTGDAFKLQAAPERALDVFHHPYAYAALKGHAQNERLAIRASWNLGGPASRCRRKPRDRTRVLIVMLKVAFI
ncbi:MAG: hypothetical protein ACTHQQ_01695 [Solirubrobacteraceae bacterium]